MVLDAAGGSVKEESSSGKHAPTSEINLDDCRYDCVVKWGNAHAFLSQNDV